MSLSVSDTFIRADVASGWGVATDSNVWSSIVTPAPVGSGITSSMSITPTNSNDLYWGVVMDNPSSSTVSWTLNTGWTNEGNWPNNVNSPDMIVGSIGYGGGVSGAQTFTSLPSPAATSWTGAVAAFKPTGSSVTRGQSGAANGEFGASTVTCTFSTNPTAGSAILVAVGRYNNPTTPTVTDNAGNTYSVVTDGTTQAASSNSTPNNQLWIFKADGIVLPGSGTLVVTATGDGVSGTSIFAQEIIGATTGNADKVVVGSGNIQPNASVYVSVQTGTVYAADSNSAASTVINLLGNNLSGTDTETLLEFAVDSTTASAGAAFNSYGSSGSFGYYLCYISNGNMVLSKYFNGTTTTLQTVSASITTGLNYWMRVQATGTGSIVARFWEDGTSEPTSWNISVTDSSPLSYPGKSGVYAAPGTASKGVYFINFSSGALYPNQINLTYSDAGSQSDVQGFVTTPMVTGVLQSGILSQSGMIPNASVIVITNTVAAATGITSVSGTTSRTYALVPLSVASSSSSTIGLTSPSFTYLANSDILSLSAVTFTPREASEFGVGMSSVSAVASVNNSSFSANPVVSVSFITMQSFSSIGISLSVNNQIQSEVGGGASGMSAVASCFVYSSSNL